MQDDRDSAPAGAAPHISPEEAAAREARAQRLAAALRENLRRRKAQARGRRAGEAEASAPSTDDTGGGSNGA